jgi:hypothetical protein
MRGAIVLVAMVAGCFSPSYHEPACGAQNECPPGLSCMAGTCKAGFDASLDVPIDAPRLNCFGTGLDVDVCLTALPGAELHVESDRAVNTNDGSSDCDPGVSAFCVIAGAGVRIDEVNTLSASGTRPLIVVSTEEIVVDGAIDVASGLTPLRVGPAADSARCHDGTPATGTHGGGWGGSLGTKGGDGGPVGGAMAGTTLVPTTLQGGCKGSDGASAGGQAGHGGGAVYLIATSISVSGTINASGGSGSGAAGGGRGGGGAGSGGMIVFDTPMLTVAPGAEIFANGGGGGEGSGGNAGVNGVDPLAPGAGGVGGIGTTTGGDGGVGGFGITAGGAGLPASAGADGTGGGGGGAGVIKVFRAVAPVTGAISPPFS